MTTTHSGMAFRDWLTSDGHFMLIYPWFQATGEKFIEHGHRLLGATVGLLALGLVLVISRTETRAAGYADLAGLFSRALSCRAFWEGCGLFLRWIMTTWPARWRWCMVVRDRCFSPFAWP